MKAKLMRILELNFERTWRGGERQTLYNSQGFIDAGIKVDVLCRENFPLEQKAKEQGIPTVAFKNVFGAIWFLMTKGRKYDVLHAQTSHILTYCIVTKPFHRAKVVFTRRIDFVPKGRMTRLKYKLSDHVVAISKAIQQIVTNFGVKNVVHISSAIVPKKLDIDRARDVVREMNLPPRTKIIATTSAIVGHKDPLMMVAAINELAKLRNDFVFLHFGKGDMQDVVREKLEELGLQGIYKIMGFHDKVEDFFSVMKVFAMSSSQEGLGSSVLDAFIYKVPVVSTDAGGLKDLVGENRGMMSSVGDAKALARNMNTLLDNPEMGEKMAARAYQFAATQHNIQHITQQYLTLLNVPFKQNITTHKHPIGKLPVEV
ncbi:glycosyltransferase involved in cell wall biosynthesis [Chitinophaga skermanii]|uniref:Glycosyltransferase involved in cell wall biosynthesis n=1 Tax=Chitinophaga skermanii TaxID=331697 RepID=A0A327QCA9_9BACT|nr:glycosyltransferase family 4 protein [Chitinophaga skermanii]RAJ02286.1 glycosyltransferase involved in cell wall biosynthesis [Chitinophaga skermanii]